MVQGIPVHAIRVMYQSCSEAVGRRAQRGGLSLWGSFFYHFAFMSEEK